MKKLAILAAFLVQPALAEEAPHIDQAMHNIFDTCLVPEKLVSGPGGNYQDIMAMGVCYGWVLGWFEGNSKPTYCAPAARIYDSILIFNAFVRKNPVWRTRYPGDALRASMEDAFPCPHK